jgi:hypothetical protein
MKKYKINKVEFFLATQRIKFEKRIASKYCSKITRIFLVILKDITGFYRAIEN